LGRSHKRFDTLHPGTLFDLRYRNDNSTDIGIAKELYAQIMDTLRAGRVSPQNALTALQMCFDELEDAFTHDIPSWALEGFDYRKSALTPDD